MTIPTATITATPIPTSTITSTPTVTPEPELTFNQLFQKIGLGNYDLVFLKKDAKLMVDVFSLVDGKVADKPDYQERFVSEHMAINRAGKDFKDRYQKVFIVNKDLPEKTEEGQRLIPEFTMNIGENGELIFRIAYMPTDQLEWANDAIAEIQVAKSLKLTRNELKQVLATIWLAGENTYGIAVLQSPRYPPPYYANMMGVSTGRVQRQANLYFIEMMVYNPDQPALLPVWIPQAHYYDASSEGGLRIMPAKDFLRLYEGQSRLMNVWDDISLYAGQITVQCNPAVIICDETMQHSCTEEIAAFYANMVAPPDIFIGTASTRFEEDEQMYHDNLYYVIDPGSRWKESELWNSPADNQTARSVCGLDQLIKQYLSDNFTRRFPLT